MYILPRYNNIITKKEILIFNIIPKVNDVLIFKKNTYI